MAEKKSYTVDEVLEKIGSFGSYQIRLLCLLSVLEWFVSGYQTLLMSFIAAEPKWRCVTNSTSCTQSGEFSPKDDYYKTRCSMNRSEWEFTNEFTSVVTDFDLICGSTFLASLSSSLVFGGWLISALFAGFLADRFGRKKLILLMFPMALFGFLSSFAKVYWLFAVLRLLVGISKGGAVMPMFVIITEYVGKRHRHIGGTALWFSWVASLLTLGMLAYFIRNWRTLSIVVGAVGMSVIVVWPFVPESSRYLLVKGKRKESEKILRKIAKVNKKEYPMVDLVCFEKQTTGNIRDLFRTWQMTHKTLVNWFNWAIIAMVYYGVTLNAPSLGGSIYLNFTLTSLMELPAYALGIWTMGRFGRKKSLVWSLIIATIASIGTVLLTMYDKDNTDGFLVGRITMACIAKLNISLAFAVIYVFSAELFPTVVRSLGMGSCSATARVGSFSSPYVASLDRIHKILPYTIMGVLSLVACILSMTLPETNDVPLDDVLEKGEEARSEEQELDKFLLADRGEKKEALNGNFLPGTSPEDKNGHDKENRDNSNDTEILISNDNSSGENATNPVA